MVVGCGPACGGSGCWFALGCVCSGDGVGLDVWTEAGCDVGWVSAAFCATALSESSRVAVTIQFKVRITRISMFLQKAKCFFNTPTGKPRVRPRWNPPPDHCVAQA